jgi:hypothetical protein
LTPISESTGSQFAMSPRWRDPPDQRSLPYLIELLALPAAMSILLVFFYVVRGSVQHGERLRLAMAERSAATYHCNSLGSAQGTNTCLRQLNAPAVAGVAQPVLLVAAEAPLR